MRRAAETQASCVCAVIALLGLPVAALGDDGRPAEQYDKLVRPFLVRHCLECHGVEKPKGDLRLDRLSSDFADEASREQLPAFPEVGRAADAPERRRDAVIIYDKNADHLWNRMHQALFVRTARDGQTLGHDEVDPLLWPSTKHLLTGQSHIDAVRLLDEFLTRDGDKLVRDPVQRAVLQHDLWTVFEWSAYPYGWPERHYDAEKHATARRALQRRLVQAIQRLALNPSDIESLPDNYAAAVKSKAFATQDDPEHPDKPFLPPDLFDPHGPWVCVGTGRWGAPPLALEHTRFFSGRSVFLVFLRLPDGRDKTLAYLEKLNIVPSPWVLRQRRPNETSRSDLLALSPNLPQFPVGTQVALVRQMVLISDAGKLVATSVTETVQLRVYRRIREVGDEREDQKKDSQTFSEFALRRSDLFADKAGGLHPVQADQQAYLFLQFFTGTEDPFEPSGDEHSRAHLAPILKTCAECHAKTGIYSVNSFTHGTRSSARAQVDLLLWPNSVNDERQRVLEWKQEQYDWGLFQGFSAW